MLIYYTQRKMFIEVTYKEITCKEIVPCKIRARPLSGICAVESKRFNHRGFYVTV